MLLPLRDIVRAAFCGAGITGVFVVPELQPAKMTAASANANS